MKVAAAIVGGSFMAALLTTLALVVVGLYMSDAMSADSWLAYLSWFGLAWATCIVVAGTVGLAWHAIAQTRCWTSVHAYWPPAMLVGLIITASLVGGLIAILLPGAALGGLTGLFAWLIRRPDRDANPATSRP